MSRGWLLFLVGAVALLVHLPARSGKFLYYDDDRYVVRNKEIESLERPWRFFLDLDTLTSPDAPTRDVYRPVRSLSYAVLVRLFGKESAGPFHTLQILLHAASAALLAWLLLESGLGRWPAAAGALAFALHPVTVEATAWVCSLGDVWCGFFVLCSVLAWARDRRVLAFLALLLALLSKEHAVVVPGLWLAWDLCLRRERLAAGGGARTVGLGVGLGLLLAGGFLLFRGLYVGAKMSQVDQSWGLLRMIAGLGWYAAGLLFPVGPTFNARVPEPGSWLSLSVLSGVVAFLALLYGAGKGSPRVRLASIWFLFALVPVSNLFVTLKIPTADRFLYIPLMGLAFGAGELVRRTRPWSAGLAPVVLLLFAALTVVRIGDWRDDEALLQAGRRVDPKSKALLWAEAAFNARRAVDRVLAGDAPAAEVLAERSVKLYETYLNNTQPVEQTQALVELGDLLYTIGEGRALYAPARSRAAFSPAMEAYVHARRLQMAGIGRRTEEEVRHTARRIVALSVALADLRNKQLPQAIAVGLEALQFLEREYGADMTVPRMKLRLVDSIRARVKQPQQAREGFDSVLETADELERNGVGGLGFLRAQAIFYRSVLTDMDPSIPELKRAYQLYRQAAEESRSNRLRSLAYAARCACVLGRFTRDPKWTERGRATLEAIPRIARKERLRLDPELRNEILALESSCGR